MESNLFDLNAIESQQQAVDIATTLISGLYDQKKNLRREFLKEIFTQLYKIVADKQTKKPVSNYYNMIVLKEMILHRDKKVIGIINSSQLIDLFEKYGLTVDPKKKIGDKGLKLFKNDKTNTIGNKFMRILLEMLVYLAQLYANNSNNQPTKFKKTISRFQEQGVVLPKQFIYYPDLKKKTSKIQKQIQKPLSKQLTKPIQKKNNSASLQSLLRFVSFKINEHISDLDDAAQQQDIQQMQQKIISGHKMFEGESKKFQELGQSIYNNPETIVAKYLQVDGFLQTEGTIFAEQMPKNDISSYYQRLKIQYQQIFGSQQNQKATPAPAKSSINKMLQNVQKVQKPIQIKPKQEKPKLSTNQQKYQRNSNIQRLQNQNKAISNVGARSIMGIFERLQSKSKSPNNGFRLVKQSLEKQKSKIQAHPPRNRNEAMRTVASTLTKTGMKLSSIFKNPPNLAPPYKNFDGEIVLPSKQLQNILYEIKRDQGHRRFKIANFRNRYPLFENETLQIGFKSQSIFEENQDGFNEILSMQLYFGNKISRQLRNFQIYFQGDQNSLVYTNPRQFPTIIDAQQQIKFQLMIIPLKVPYRFLNMKIMYQNMGQAIHTTVALPNSIIKMTTFVDIERVQNQQYWYHSTSILKSDYFKLSHHVPPNSLRKYIPQLNQLTNYSQFSISGSNVDYQLYCLVDIMKDYECALKINIRPDLNVVIQMGMIDPSEDALKNAKFLLQSLQIILQENGQ